MLWYRCWLETRWRFLIGLGIMATSAASTVLTYPEVLELMPLASSVNIDGEIGRRISESVAISSTYGGYLWSNLFDQNLTQMGTLFAVLLGTAGPLSHASGHGTLFMLSLPVSRNRLFYVRAATGLIELLLLALVPSLLVILFSPAIAQSFALTDSLVYGLCLFLVATLFFSFALLLSTVFADVWRPLLITCVIAFIMAMVSFALDTWSIFTVMSGENYFRVGSPPWLGLLFSVILSVMLLYGAAYNLASRDF